VLAMIWGGVCWLWGNVQMWKMGKARVGMGKCICAVARSGKYRPGLIRYKKREDGRKVMLGEDHEEHSRLIYFAW
jgi:hypothetical protein